MSFTGLLNQAAIVERVTSTTDSVGGLVEAWAMVGEIKCRIVPLSARERAMRGTLGVDVSHKAFCALGDFTERDRLRVGATIYRITGIRDAAGHGHHWSVDLQEIRDGGQS